MTKITNEERLMRVETQIETLISEVRDMRKDIKSWSGTFVRKEDYDKSIGRLNEKIEKVDRRRWVQNTLSALLGAVLAILVSFWFTNL